MEPSHSTPKASDDIFATTRWTVVLAAGKRHTDESDQALEDLCRTYWFPLYAYVRRRGYSKEDAEDLTQAYFARLLKRNDLEGVRRERGRFRAFLLTSLKHFLINEWKRGQRHKRGRGETPLSLDWQTADTQFQLADPAELSPDKAFDREWAVALLGKVLDRLQSEREAQGRRKEFDQIKGFLARDAATRNYPEVAQALGMEEGAVRVAVHRLRKRYRQLLRDEIAHTLSDSAEVQEELRALFGAFES